MGGKTTCNVCPVGPAPQVLLTGWSILSEVRGGEGTQGWFGWREAVETGTGPHDQSGDRHNMQARLGQTAKL